MSTVVHFMSFELPPNMELLVVVAPLSFTNRYYAMCCCCKSSKIKMDLSFVAFQLADVFDVNYLSHTASKINIPTHLQISNNKMLLLITQ